jgi:GTP-binding protein
MASSNFVDYVKIFCRSGKGGAGSAHFIRNKLTSKGGPDGGDGGRGGHIILRGNKQLWTLLHIKYTKHIHAGHGDPGGQQLSSGKTGKDIILEVPLGVVVKDAETQEVIFEITKEGEERILLQGGRGGQGNDHFKSATNQAPKYAQPGEEGLEKWVILELKILADVGLVGFPNAGKSTLLSVISAAKPEIADYPFTTLKPNLGMVAYRDDRSFLVADIPGIIEGAHKGKGLGLRFLRHIERNAVLLFMVAVDCNDIRKEYRSLLFELEKYNPELLDKPKLLCVTKIDILDDEMMQDIHKEIDDLNPVYISAVANKGLQKLKDRLWESINADHYFEQ